MISKQKMDPELEDKTQEAIGEKKTTCLKRIVPFHATGSNITIINFFPTDLYFSQHHKVTSPEEVLPISYGASQRSMLMESVGNSPDLANENSR